jgi:1-acyl-sn-glycerol-3-phosphate acyltransferase
MRRRGDLNVWWRIGLVIAGPVTSALFRIRVVGATHVPTSGPAVIASNHVSALDGPVLAVVIARSRGRMTRFVTGAEFFGRPAYGWVLRLFRQIPIRRGRGDEGALDDAIRTVRDGALAAIFPEGRVNPTPAGGLQRGRSGVARIALPAAAPVVPVAVWGTHDRWPRAGLRRTPPFRTRITVVFGPPLSDDGDATSYEDAAAFTKTVMQAIGRSLDDAREVHDDG